MEMITAYIRVENECTNKSFTEEEKNNLPKVSDNINSNEYFDPEEFARRVYAKVISYAYMAYADKTDVYVTVLVGIKDTEFDSSEQMPNVLSLDFRFSKESAQERCTWETLQAPKQKNIAHLNIENTVYSMLYSAVSAAYTAASLTKNP